MAKAMTSLLTSSMVRDLEDSGLSTKTIENLCIRPASTIELDSCNLRLGTETEVPYVIPYFDIKGVPIAHFRLKMLGYDVVERGFKYKQPKGSTNKLYFPPGFLKLAKTSPFVIFTEGEKKAAAGVQAGYPTIGLGGVDSWRSRTFELDVHSMHHTARGKQTRLTVRLNGGSTNRSVVEMEAGVADGMVDLMDFMRLHNKIAIIIFDSDLEGAPYVKGEVQRAVADLAYFLRAEQGLDALKVRQVALPTNSALKLGLDDYILQHGRGGLEELINASLIEEPNKAYPKRPNFDLWLKKQLSTIKLNRESIEKVAISTVSEMDARGRRLAAPDNRFYYFDSERKVVYPAAYIGPAEKFMPDASFGVYLYKYYGLRSRDVRIKEGILDAFTAEEPITRVVPHRGMRITGDQIDMQLSDSHLLSVSATSIKVADNGEGGTLFLANQVEPLEIVQRDLSTFNTNRKVESYWLHVIKTLRLEPIAGMSLEETQELVACLFHCSPWLNRWRGTQLPLEVACAEAGSGKSSLYALRLLINTGRPELQNVPQDLRDWYASIAESPGIWVGDNVRFTGRDMKQRLSDELCRLITEPDPHVSLRRLYTTADRARIPVNTVFAVTSIYPPFQAADLQQRSVSLRFSAIPEGDRTGNWVENQLGIFGGRTKWMMHLAFVLKDFFVHVEKRWHSGYKSHHRLINFEQCMVLMAEVLGFTHLNEDSMSRMVQAAPGAADDTTMEGLKSFAKESGKGTYAASDIVGWAEAEDDYKQDFVLTNSRKLGHYIKAHEYDIKKYTGIARKVHANRTMYTI